VKSLRWSTSGGSSTYAERVPNEEIERLRAAATTVATGYPAVYYAIVGANVLKVYPTPSAADTITVFYVPRPTAMSAAQRPVRHHLRRRARRSIHKAIVLYAEWQAADYRDDESSSQGERYRQLYEDEIKRIRRYVTLHGGRLGKAHSCIRPVVGRLPRVTVTRAGRRWQPRRAAGHVGQGHGPRLPAQQDAERVRLELR
jgi:hypothetical protein